MTQSLRTAAAVGAATLAFSIAPFSVSLSPEALAMLDPSRQATTLCANRPGADILQARLQLASAYAAARPAGDGSVPLVGGLFAPRLAPTTDSVGARRYFGQGLVLAYGFNHDGAIRSFRAAQRLDPQCALCFWGEAVALGPNINAPMDPAANAAALTAMRQAIALRDRAAPRERALIDATALRYSADPAVERSVLDLAFADAMLAAARAFPDDDDISVLAAEAAMNTSPWDYWEPGGRTAKGRIGAALRLVETVLARNPDHPPAIHLYIHLMEASAAPKRAESYADRLAALASAAGHLVHMPAHIYYRLGRWGDSIRANVAAARADEAWFALAGGGGIYRYGYYPHNVHFIVNSAQMAGDLTTVVRESTRLANILDPAVSQEIAWIQTINAAPYFAHAQFSDPEVVLALPAADPRLPYVEAIRRYARAVARAHQRDRAGLEDELAALRRIRDGADFDAMIAQGVPAPDLLRLAELGARGRFALAIGDADRAVRLFRAAAEIEEGLAYMEPPYWYYPVRQSLGAALYEAGRYADAKEAFRAALAATPANGWALWGLAQAEQALGNPVEAAAARGAFQRAWLGDPAWLRMDRL
jgi:tetratricopeptide (TPR) repeat protein